MKFAYYPKIMGQNVIFWIIFDQRWADGLYTIFESFNLYIYILFQIIQQKFKKNIIN